MYEKSKIPQLFLSLMLCLTMVFLGKACLVYHKQISRFLYVQLEKNMMDDSAPSLEYLALSAEDAGADAEDYGKKLILQWIPAYRYVLGYPQTAMNYEDHELRQQLILSEARDEGSEAAQSGEYAQRSPDGSDSENPVEMRIGNAADAAQKAVAGSDDKSALETRKEPADEADYEAGSEGNGSQKDFAVHTVKLQEISLGPLHDFDTLLSRYYVLDGSTTIGPGQLNVDKLLACDLHLAPGGKLPQILIYHTHSREAFADSDPADPSTTIVGAGEKLAQLLREYGFSVIHHTGQYDGKGRDYAYANAAPAIEQILKENPSIEMIIDLHRDGVAEGTHIVTRIDDKPMAQFMFFNGLSRTKVRGDIEYLPNPYVDENLAFSFQAQLVAEEYYPGLARRIYLKGYRYNMHYRPRTLLIELGAQTNTVEEIMNAVDPLAHILKITLCGE
ncbi:MAG: stage II sporulation protein P [Lachnospiraceae bacterium]|nr:stage II sporulation protein P [Lachnospiraceae bacterium]